MPSLGYFAGVSGPEELSPGVLLAEDAGEEGGGGRQAGGGRAAGGGGG